MSQDRAHSIHKVQRTLLRALTLRRKILLALTALTLTLLVVFIGLLRWGLHRNLGDYVAEIELGRLDWFANKLEQAYTSNGSWSFLSQDTDAWRRLRRFDPPDRQNGPNSPNGPNGPDGLSRPGPNSSGPPDWDNGPSGRPPPPPDWERSDGKRVGPPPRPDDLGGGPHDSIYDRLALVAPDGAQIAGAARARSSPIRRALTSQGQVIAYLAVEPMDTSSTAAGRSFLTQQAVFVLVICGIGYAVALLLSWFLAERWLRPIRHLTDGADAIAQGRLDTQVPVLGHDELSRLTVTFNTMARQLQQTDERHQHWLSEIAHELRTPLAAMRAEIEATMDGVRPLNPLTMERLHRQILRLGQLVEDLRRSMHDTEKPSRKEPGVRPLDVLLDTLTLMQARFAQVPLQVNAETVQTLANQTSVTLSGNAAELQQVFTNIFENTLRYTNPGGQVRVSATLLRQQTQLRIRIEDTPPAPAVADMPRLFERLYRGESSRDRASGGSGLGLAICKQIIEAHGGTIRGDDSELGGLCLELLFPVKCDDANPP